MSIYPKTLDACLNSEHRQAGYYLEEDEDFLYLKRGHKVLAVWNAAKATRETVQAAIDKIPAEQTEAQAMALLCENCHKQSGCHQLHKNFTTGRCESCGKEAMCVNCVDVARFLGELISKLDQAGGFDTKAVTPEEIMAAMQRYPDIPLPLAVTRYMLDQALEKNPPGALAPGQYWGRVHLERVGTVLQRLVQAMYEQRKKSIAVRFSAEDFPETWDHIGIGIEEVDAGSKEEIDRMGIAGWPCCFCAETIKGDDTEAAVMLLHKRAKWKYPVWGNVLDGICFGLALAALCGRCAKEGRKPGYAIKKDGDRFERIPIAELEDGNCS